jgi:cyclopropane-fatty-acyl-phospholipid synthase
VGAEAGVAARIVVHDVRTWAAVALRGAIGAGEAYAHGQWASPEPANVVRWMLQNEPVLASLDGGLARLARPRLEGYHRRRRNTAAGARRNIADHYDLGDDLFELFLDPSMTYSCAHFAPGIDDLELAQQSKLDLLVERLAVGPGDHVLEIGTGWGALAVRLAARTGCRVTTTTISPSQREAADARVKAAGLEGRVTVLERDYRDLEGTYDGVVSVEMIEAVGAEHYGEFMRVLARRLRPGGRAWLQAITIRDELYDRARAGVDFIQRYVFPGSDIPSVGALKEAAREAGLAPGPSHDLTEHYPRTLAAWARRLAARRDEARARGFDDVFLRLWEWYFAYCAGGFLERRLGLMHLAYDHGAEAARRRREVASR